MTSTTGGVTLDSGALIAAEKNDRAFWVMWAAVLKRAEHIRLPAVVLAQVWRGGSPLMARLLRACELDVIGSFDAAKRIGQVLAKSRTSDVVDAAVVVGAAARGDRILTSDPDDIERLVSALGADVLVVRI